MVREYLPLTLYPLRPASRFVDLDQHAEQLGIDSPALAAMTDLREIPAATIDALAPVDAAHRFMIRRGVRLLLVTDAERRVEGLITATDILGEKPVQAALARSVPRHDLKVADIMTARHALQCLDYAEVARSRIGHVVATLRHEGRQHALVCEREKNADGVRGIFSLSQIARQLGVNLQATEIAQTFAEIEAALGH